MTLYLTMDMISSFEVTKIEPDEISALNPLIFFKELRVKIRQSKQSDNTISPAGEVEQQSPELEQMLAFARKALERTKAYEDRERRKAEYRKKILARLERMRRQSFETECEFQSATKLLPPSLRYRLHRGRMVFMPIAHPFDLIEEISQSYDTNTPQWANTQVAVQEWMIAYKAQDPSTRNANTLWEQYVASQETLLDYLRDNATDAQASKTGSISVNLTNLDSALKFSMDTQTLLSRFLEAVREWYTGRPQTAAPNITRAPDYAIHTSLEFDALFRAVADGKTGANWKTDLQALTRTHTSPNSPHYVRLSAMQEELAEISEQAIVAKMERLTYGQDADCVFAILYVSRLLAPPSPLPPNASPVDWVDLDDVMSKIGWKPRSSKEREQMRSQVWDYLVFGARAGVYGQRTGQTITDPDTGEKISTSLDGPLWAFHDRVRTSLFESMDVPIKVEISMTRAWTRLVTSRQTVQYLPLGELLGSISGDQPSGAWARCIGLTLANFWRRNPREALDGSLLPTRREMLSRYTPKVTPPFEVLAGPNPKRAQEYWRQALQILVQSQFLADAGEASSAIRSSKIWPRQGWQEVWLDERVYLRPGPLMQSAVETSANALPARKLRNLRSKSPRPKAK